MNSDSQCTSLVMVTDGVRAYIGVFNTLPSLKALILLITKPFTCLDTSLYNFILFYTITVKAVFISFSVSYIIKKNTPTSMYLIILSTSNY